MILFSSLASICQGKIIQQYKDREVHALIIDSRKVLLSEQALFFAISGSVMMVISIFQIYMMLASVSLSLKNW
jgi:hypothetical protein